MEKETYFFAKRDLNNIYILYMYIYILYMYIYIYTIYIYIGRGEEGKRARGEEGKKRRGEEARQNSSHAQTQ